MLMSHLVAKSVLCHCSSHQSSTHCQLHWDQHYCSGWGSDCSESSLPLQERMRDHCAVNSSLHPRSMTVSLLPGRHDSHRSDLLLNQPFEHPLLRGYPTHSAHFIYTCSVPGVERANMQLR